MLTLVSFIFFKLNFNRENNGYNGERLSFLESL